MAIVVNYNVDEVLLRNAFTQQNCGNDTWRVIHLLLRLASRLRKKGKLENNDGATRLFGIICSFRDIYF